MKEIPQSNQQSPEWESSLLNDLVFIKKNLRYPVTRKIFLPIVGISSSVVVAGFLAVKILGARNGHEGGGVFPGIILGLVTLITIITTNRYLGTLRFMDINTGFTLAENIKLLQKFLQEKRLVTFRHPDAPEVFQIISTNINPFGDQREILIFIADDSRILINSHFTFSAKIYPGQRHHKEMANMFKEWLRSRQLNPKATASRR